MIRLTENVITVCKEVSWIH